jgi:tetratricopeptide (TPR) repeat protein
MTVQMTVNKSAIYAADTGSDRLHAYFIKLIVVLMIYRRQVPPAGGISVTLLHMIMVLVTLILLLQCDSLVSLAQPNDTTTDQLLGTQPNDPTTDQLLEKGESLYAQGNFTEAIQYYNQVLAVDLNNTAAIYDKGLALDVLGKHVDAIAHYNKLLSLQPENVNALVNKGGALGDLGNYQEAIKYFDKVLSIDPNNDLAAENKKLATSLLNNNTAT